MLLHFINYKLYHSEGLLYPPAVDDVFSNTNCALAAPGLKLKAIPVAGEEEEEEEQSWEEAMQESIPLKEKPLLGDCFFYLSREVFTSSLCT